MSPTGLARFESALNAAFKLSPLNLINRWLAGTVTAIWTAKTFCLTSFTVASPEKRFSYRRGIPIRFTVVLQLLAWTNNGDAGTWTAWHYSALRRWVFGVTKLKLDAVSAAKCKQKIRRGSAMGIFTETNRKVLSEEDRTKTSEKALL